MVIRVKEVLIFLMLLNYKEKHETVYVKADMNSVCYEPQIKIMDVMSVQCSDPAIAAGVKNKTLYTFKKDVGKKKKRIEVFSILNVIDLIQQDYPNVEVVSYGEQDFVVEYIASTIAPSHFEKKNRIQPNCSNSCGALVMHSMWFWRTM